ncbi:MAG: YciI family protein [Candidatus Dormibacteria bacterium]
MRYMVLVKASEESEKGALPPLELVEEMQRYNDELVRAGVMLAADGLHSSSRGVRIRFDGDQKTVIDGPFAETKELIAGYWIFQVRSREEAIEWVKRAPFGGGTEVEVREVFEPAELMASLNG